MSLENGVQKGHVYEFVHMKNARIFTCDYRLDWKLHL